jgi:hypothetical protein
MRRTVVLATALVLVSASAAWGANAHRLREAGTGTDTFVNCVGAAAVTGDATPQFWPQPSGKCRFHLAGTVHGKPIFHGTYDATILVNFDNATGNGHGGFCWRWGGVFTITNQPAINSLTEHVHGIVCEDGPDMSPTAATFVGRFTVTAGTGTLQGATDSGRILIQEDASGNDTLVEVGHVRF